MTTVKRLLNVSGDHATEAAAMKADDLTRDQCRAIRAKVKPFRDYLHPLRVRMSKRGFPPDDPLYQLMLNAQ